MKEQTVYTNYQLRKLQKEYRRATPVERRAIEIRDLGYPLTPVVDKALPKTRLPSPLPPRQRVNVL